MLHLLPAAMCATLLIAHEVLPHITNMTMSHDYLRRVGIDSSTTEVVSKRNKHGVELGSSEQDGLERDWNCRRRVYTGVLLIFFQCRTLKLTLISRKSLQLLYHVEKLTMSGHYLGYERRIERCI